MNAEQYMRQELDAQTVNGKFTMPVAQEAPRFSRKDMREYLLKAYPDGKSLLSIGIDTGWCKDSANKLIHRLIASGELVKRKSTGGRPRNASS